MYLTNKELSDSLNITRNYLRRLAKAGTIEGTVTTPNGDIKFDTTLPKLARILAMTPEERDRIYQWPRPSNLSP